MIASHRTVGSTLVLAALGLVIALSPASATAALGLDVTTRHLPSKISAPMMEEKVGLPLDARATWQPAVINTGDEFMFGPVTVTFEVEEGLEITAASGQWRGFTKAWSCSVAPDARSATCLGPEGIPVFPGQEPCEFLAEEWDEFLCPPRFAVTTAQGAEPGDTFKVSLEACGGGAPTCDAEEDEITVVPRFEVIDFDSGSFAGHYKPDTPINYDPIMEQSGDPQTQAASHPEVQSVKYMLSQAGGADGFLYATVDQKDVIVDFPPGLLVNVEAIPTCVDAELSSGGNPTCPVESQIGYISINILGRASRRYGSIIRSYEPLFNMEAPRGKAATFGFNVLGSVFHLTGFLKRDPDVAGGYRATVSLLNSPQPLPINGSSVSVWGVPADESHDDERDWDSSLGHVSDFAYNNDVWGKSCIVVGFGCREPHESFAEKAPFVTLPTSCPDELRTDITVTTWQGLTATTGSINHAIGDPENPLGLEGCNNLAFDPSIEARPTTNVADSPSGLDVSLHIPQNLDPTETGTAHMRDTVLTLPEGFVINPAGANGLAGCTPAQFEWFGEKPVRCPDASRLGTVRVETPILDHPLLGAVYQAMPYDNPFDSLLAIYIALEDPESGTEVKVPGEVKLDPVTGQVTASVLSSPQVPFEDFRLRFFGGAGGPLRTPPVCGNYTTTSSITPWSAPESGPAVTPRDSWTIEQSPQGGSCASSEQELPNTPSFDGGTESPIAGAKSPLVVNLRRQDGSQEFSAVTLSPPPGMIGKLAGIPYCPEQALLEAASKKGAAEMANPSCPIASRVGAVVASAGAGPAPYHAPGTAYLTGPYKGAPLSLAIVTPAVAGPFDLGTIVVRVALHIDPVTAQITAVSDEIPAIKQGIPLDVRAIQVKLDRPDFTINPTSCNPMAFGAQVLSNLGLNSSLESRFQLGECDRLGFKPKMTVSLKGATGRGKHPALTTVLRTRPGDANLRSISVALPSAVLLDQGNIDTVCTRVQFAVSNCPAGAAYGNATVTTPLLDHQLSGPVYLRSSNNPLPDLVLDLRGPAHQPIRLEPSGQTDTVKGGLRNTFRTVPDASFSKVVLRLRGGRKQGLLNLSTNICGRTFRATIKAIAHNGAVAHLRPALRTSCKDSKRAKRGSGRRAAR